MRILKIIFIAFVLVSIAGSSLPVNASRIDELRLKISEHDAEIGKIQKEIELYQEQLDKTLGEKASLDRDIKKLDITRKKLSSDVYLTEKQIESASLKIEQIEIEIGLKADDIEKKKNGLAEIIRNTRELENQSLLEIILANNRFSDFFGDLERMESLQNGINVNLAELKNLKESLHNRKESEAEQRADLETLKDRLIDQRILVDNNRYEKNKLLNETKSKESNYRKILNERIAKQKALEEEIQELAAQIQIEIDPDSLPVAGSGVLKWPLDKVYITQGFGQTEFAAQNPGIYKGVGHNGVDFRASIGTPVKAAADGVVVGVGNTDAGCYGASYGKWVLVEHPNNLSTIYAHLSLAKVSFGQKVRVGEVIAYSGDSGFAIGPHLHFTVAAAKAVKIMTIKTKTCGTNITLPLAPNNAYLNPLSYL